MGDDAETKPKRTRRQRGRGEDSVYQRSSDKRWFVEIRDGYKPSGKPNIIYLSAKTKHEALRKRDKVREELRQGLPRSNETLTVAAYLKHWLEHTVKPSLRTKTYEGYESFCRIHIIPAIGRKHLSKLSSLDVQSLMSKMEESGVSPTTVKHARAMLRKALNDAIRDDLIAKNVVTRTAMPAQRAYHPKPLTEEELPRFLAATKGHRLEALWQTLVTIGLRSGEAFGLRWQDVDLEGGSLAVRYQIQRSGSPPVAQFTDPKTERSRQAIPLPPQLVTALREHRGRQQKEIRLAGDRWQGEQWQHLVFCTTIGTPLDSSNVLKQFRDLLKGAGLDPDRRVHDLRHTCGTMLARLGVHPREVQEILRHAQIQTTLSIYTQVGSEGLQSAVNRLGDMLSGDDREGEA